MNKKIIVIGAGVIGVTTAYYLNKAGFEVEVVERNGKTASKCSFANGGQLSYSHIEPWATPNLFRNLPKWLIKSDSPLKFHSHFDYKMWLWILSFLGNCNKAKSIATAKHIGDLALESKQLMQKIIADEHIDFNHASNGTLHLFSTVKGFNQNIKLCKLQEKLGFKFEILNSYEQCLKIEPALANTRRKIIGGIYYKDDECGDVHLFTTKLSNILQKKGVKFYFNTDVEGVEKNSNHISHLKTSKGKMCADKYVFATGVSSDVFLDEFGIKNKIYPLKGYSLTFRTDESMNLPKVNITDQSNKIVYSRLGENLRVAGMVDFARYSDSIFEKRIETLHCKIAEFFPDIKLSSEVQRWSCLRPSTSYCQPIISKSSHDNLYFNTGHGSLGWTLALASAKRLSLLVKV